MLRLRRIVAVFLVTLGGLVIALGSSGWWLERNFFDTGNFTGLTDEILDQDEVQTAVSQLIVTQLTDGRPKLEVAAPFITPIVQQIVFSDTFRNVFDKALTAVHRTVVDRDVPDIVLDLSAIYGRIRAALEEIAPNLAAELPAKDELKISILDRTQLPAVWDAVDAARAAVLWVTLGGVALLAIGVAIAPRRWRTLALAAWATAAGLLLLLVGLWIGQGVVLGAIAEDVYRSAASATWDVTTTGLVIQTVVLAVLFGLLAVLARWTDRSGGWAAYPALARRSLAGIRTTWQRLRPAPRPAPAPGPGVEPLPGGLAVATETGVALAGGAAPATVAGVDRAVWGRALRAAVIAVLGLYLVFRPDSFGRFVVLLAGLGAIVFAALEVRNLARHEPAF